MMPMMMPATSRPPQPPVREAEIPAGEVAGDDRADAQRPERPDARIALEAALSK